MNDNDIVKALELCANRTIHSCKFCPCNSGIECNKKLNEGALDLIKRQKAEIEKLKNTDFQVEVSSRLEKEIRAEAIKEFSENLKQQAFECDVSFSFGKEHYTKAVAVVDIERLVEEMTEDETQKQIDNAPIEDVVEVVRCKDCEYNNECSVQDFGEMHQNDFCSHGKRKELDNAKLH